MIFLHCICFGFFSQKPHHARRTASPVQHKSRTASTTHDCPAFFQLNPLPNYYHHHNNIPGNLGPAFTHTRTRPGIYTRGKRECGSVTRAQAHPRATTVPGVSLRWEKLAVRQNVQRNQPVHCAGRITDRVSANGAGRVNCWHFLGCQRCRACRFG